MTNKEKTKVSALKLFNEMGYANVRLQHISDDSLVSVGNMAYHFKNKQVILKSVFDDLAKDQAALLSDLGHVPIFDYIDDHLSKVYQVQYAYRFFYFDTNDILRSDPEIVSEYEQYLIWEKGQLRNLIDFNVSRGAFQLMSEESVNHLSELVSLIKSTWFTKQNLETADGEIRFKSFIWNTLKPHFSERGVLEYDQMRKLPQTKW
tara:strand:- start:321 stop:935 length:615 start_codon:yes stop_codon:yes gene_type:complete